MLYTLNFLVFVLREYNKFFLGNNFLYLDNYTK